MTKKSKIIITFFTFLFLNFAFWFCDGYPRQILEWSSLWSIVAVALHIIYFAIYHVLLIFLFQHDSTLFLPAYSTVSWKTVLKNKNFYLLFVWQLLFELLCIFLLEQLGVWRNVTEDLLIVLFFTFIFFFLRRQNTARRSLRKQEWITLVCVLGVILLLFVAFDLYEINSYLFASSKYEPSALVLERMRQNNVFIHELTILLLETLLVTFLAAFHLVTAQSPEEPPEKEARVTCVVRIHILLLASIFLTFMRGAIFPDSYLSSINVPSFRTNYHTEEFIDVHNKDLIISRKQLFDEDKVVYESFSVKTTNDSMKTVRYRWLDNEECYVAEDGELYRVKLYTIITLDGIKFEIHRNNLITFYENGEPKAVNIDKLESFGRHELILKLLRKLLSDGNVFVFEYAHDYLLTYDEAFIRPFIDRYASGNFSYMETKWMKASMYRQAYITDLAKKLAE